MVRNKVRIYKMYIRPILTYAAKMRTKTSKIKRILKTTEMRMLRVIRAVSLKNRIRNKQIGLYRT